VCCEFICALRTRVHLGVRARVVRACARACVRAGGLVCACTRPCLSLQLLALLSEFKTKSAELHERVTPLLNKLKEGELPTTAGLRYLEMKQQLLLTCVSAIACARADALPGPRGGGGRDGGGRGHCRPLRSDRQTTDMDVVGVMRQPRRNHTRTDRRGQNTEGIPLRARARAENVKCESET
jgi:hypothetical protein